MNIKDEANKLNQDSELNPLQVNLNIEEVFNEGFQYKFLDLFNLSEIQKIQDAFSLATGVASIITEVDGTPITKPSGFCSFCNNIVRNTEKGIKNCMLSDSIIGSPKVDGPRIQRCLSGGLIDGGASIMVGDKHIANWLVGQILESEYDINDMFSYADEIGVERKVFAEALNEVTRMSKQQFTDICNYLFLSAQQLSKLAIKNVLQANEIAKRKMAEQVINKLNDELEKNVLERTYQLEEINAELEESNAMLEEEVSERQKAEEEIRNLNEDLENKVSERTNQLQEMNAILEEEIFEKEKMHERLQKYQILAEKANDAMLFIDKKGNILEVNDAALKIYGYTKDEFTSMSIFDLRNIEKQSYIIEQIELADEKGIVFEAVHYRKDGTSLNVEVSSQGTFIGSSRVLLSIVRDISDRKKAEEEIIRSMKKAEEANLAKSQFLANMSHEIRTPMNGIIGMTDLALLTDLNEEQREYLTLVKSSTGLLLRVLNDILDYTKIEAGKIDLEKVQFNIRKITGEILDLFIISAKQKNIYIKLNIDERIPENLIGDSVRLRQVLSNLVGNGVKFTSSGGVEINLYIERRNINYIQLKFIISDTGIGISENKINRLFKRFSQVDESNTRKFGGTGLGLAISKKLVEMMGGEIGVESLEGVGSKFFFTAEFGVQEEDTVLTSHETSDIDYHQNKNMVVKKVLFVEDDEVSRNLGVIVLKKMGLEIVTAQNGKEAIEKFGEDTFDLILMDINMPLIDGFTATSVIRVKEKNRTPIIAMTAYALSGDREKCINAGMDDYISKPIDISELINKVNIWINKNSID